MGAEHPSVTGASSVSEEQEPLDVAEPLNLVNFSVLKKDEVWDSITFTETAPLPASLQDQFKPVPVEYLLIPGQGWTLHLLVLSCRASKQLLVPAASR